MKNFTKKPDLTKYINHYNQSNYVPLNSINAENMFADLIQITKTNMSIDDISQIKQLLTLIHPKNITSSELIGFVNYANKHMVSIKPNKPTLDIVGTGGDGKNTVNISTAASLLTASLGIPTAKHGARSNSSKSGSADLMEALGYDLMQDPAKTLEQVNNTNFGFCFAPLYHPSFKGVKDIRREMKTQTIFNLIGPLINPAHAEYRIIGVADPNHLNLFAKTLQQTSKSTLKKAVIVHCQGCDELNTIGEAQIIEVTSDKLFEYILDPKDYGFKEAKLEDLQGDDAKSNLDLIMQVFKGEKSKLADTIILNAAMGLSLYKDISLDKAVLECKEHVLSGVNILNFK